MTRVETSTPPNTPTPIGPYSHIAKVGDFITIGGTAGFDPETSPLVGPDAYSQAKRILDSFKVMLESVDSDLEHVVHLNVFLLRMAVDLGFDFTMAFQPIVNVTTREIFAHEALVRGPNNEPAADVFTHVNDANRYRVDQSCPRARGWRTSRTFARSSSPISSGSTWH